MATSSRNSDASLLRLSRYHCFLGQLQGVRSRRPVTSRELAEELGLSEETVRHDLKNVRIEGRPGAGYDAKELYAAIQEYLDLSAEHPFIAVGAPDVLAGLPVMFPAHSFGMRAVGYLTDDPEAVGRRAGDAQIASLSDAAALVAETGATLALVACAPESLDDVAQQLRDAGVRGLLVLTPVLSPLEVDGLEVTYFRIPCALKSLARTIAEPEQRSASCCGAGA